MEGDDDTAFAEDYFSEHSARPADGCLLELELLPSELEVGLAISDAAQWSVGGRRDQESFYAGYRGTVAGLLQKAAKDIEMMRGGYSRTSSTSSIASLDKSRASGRRHVISER